MEMKDGPVENGICSSESIHGGTDVWSSKESATASADHLVVMVHGILGSVTDWKFAAEQFVRILPDKVIVHRSERNASMLTLDGVDVMGERLAEEVIEVIKQKPEVRKISFVSHSVGGLVARYAIGRLYRPPRSENEDDPSDNICEENSRGTIYGLEAMNFITVATPHLGSRGNKQVPFLFGVPVFEKAATSVIHLIFRRTGRHLFLTDDDEGNPPLLRRMIEDCGELHFMRNSELPKWEDVVNEKYPHIVFEEHCKACDAEQCEPSSMEDDGLDKLEGKMPCGSVGTAAAIIAKVEWKMVVGNGLDVEIRNGTQETIK
ncbi:putative lipase YOR059C [Vitis vinifera]|uniref:Putative lipase YOR059C n=1 Tax=Vitis vinifera TaxID=29760 RepID=A0A438I531_VITVI|nr:putative lipase YOR059C [Vitis vinifera]